MAKTGGKTGLHPGLSGIAHRSHNYESQCWGAVAARRSVDPLADVVTTRSIAKEIHMPGPSVCHIYRSTDPMPARANGLPSPSARAIHPMGGGAYPSGQSVERPL